MIEDVFKEFIQIDSFFNDFFDDNFSKPKPRKKKTELIFKNLVFIILINFFITLKL